jgi:hypothetical protein
LWGKIFLPERLWNQNFFRKKEWTGLTRPYSKWRDLVRKALRLLTGAVAPLLKRFCRTVAELVLSSVCALIDFVCLSGLIALISLLGPLSLSLISRLLCLFVPGFVSLLVGKIGPIVAVICHFSIPPRALFCFKGICIISGNLRNKNYFTIGTASL